MNEFKPAIYNVSYINKEEMKKYCAVVFLMGCLSVGCSKDRIVDNTGLLNNTSATAIKVNVSTDKATYQPGDLVTFMIDQALPSTAKVRYKQAGTILQDLPVSGQTWTWTAPSIDFSGYMVELYNTVGGKEIIYGTVAVDISSDPSRFPRNGFLSAFGQLNTTQINAVMTALNRYHMNYVQFQDWEYEHHLPLSGTVANPDAMWKDIANRDNYLATIKNYISAAHHYNMKTLSYNLAYGALGDAAAAGVSDQWYLYDDASHTTREVLNLPAPPFKSNIYFTDPSNTGWQQYIAARTNDVYTVFGFDGYQIDQVGNRNKMLYTYTGAAVDLPSTFAPFINAMKASAPQKRLVMNAVTQYGQPQIAGAPVDFLYSEVWAPNEAFSDLGSIIQSNDALGGGSKKSILAAYMDYNLAGNPGYFSTPGVVLTDAVIFAFGGAHLELGEHMLGKEYFPNANLVMPDELKKAMVSYYDFLTGYENLLRDGGVFNGPPIRSSDNQLKLNNWPPQLGQVSVVGKDLGSKQVIHLLNFTNANSLQWRDPNGTQVQPVTVASPGFIFTTPKIVKRIWTASPDSNGGASADVTYTQTGDQVSFRLPSLQYWDMIVVEYQ
ncbi:MAG: glycoside hydrolase family 66 protein [Mucilaginibacter sp.]